MSEDFDVDELYNLIKIEEGILAEYIGDKRIEREVNKYIDAYYESIGMGAWVNKE